MVLLTSQDGSRTFKMDSIIGIRVWASLYLYVLLTNGKEYCIGEFSSEKRAKEVMEEFWCAVDAGVGYFVPRR